MHDPEFIGQSLDIETVSQERLNTQDLARPDHPKLKMALAIVQRLQSWLFRQSDGSVLHIATLEVGWSHLLIMIGGVVVFDPQDDGWENLSVMTCMTNYFKHISEQLTTFVGDAPESDDPTALEEIREDRDMMHLAVRRAHQESLDPDKEHRSFLDLPLRLFLKAVGGVDVTLGGALAQAYKMPGHEIAKCAGLPLRNGQPEDVMALARLMGRLSRLVLIFGGEMLANDLLGNA